MAARKKAWRGRAHWDYAMTLDEVAAAIGSNKKAVAMMQRKALDKLRARPGLFREFIVLVELRRSLREQREAGGWQSSR